MSLQIETERLLIRPFELADAEEIQAIWGDPETMRWIPSGTVDTVAAAREAVPTLDEIRAQFQASRAARSAAADAESEASRTETAQQREHRERHDADHRDLAESIEVAEVDQDDIDHVAAAALRQGAIDEEFRQRLLAARPGHDGEGETRHAETHRRGEKQIADATRPRAQRAAVRIVVLDAARQPA